MARRRKPRPLSEKARIHLLSMPPIAWCVAASAPGSAQMLASLEKRGLIESRPARVHTNRLTSAGRALVKVERLLIEAPWIKALVESGGHL